MSLLYEFTHWFVTAVISRAWTRMPAMNAFATFERWYSSEESWNAFSSPSNNDKWVCMPEPGRSVDGLGMNVAYMPRFAAVSFTTSR